MRLHLKEVFDYDIDDWEWLDDYGISYVEKDGTTHDDIGYITLFFSARTRKYCWGSSMGIECKDMYDTYNEAYEAAVAAHEPDSDEYELDVYEI